MAARGGLSGAGGELGMHVSEGAGGLQLKVFRRLTQHPVEQRLKFLPGEQSA